MRHSGIDYLILIQQLCEGSTTDLKLWRPLTKSVLKSEIFHNDIFIGFLCKFMEISGIKDHMLCHVQPHVQ